MFVLNAPYIDVVNLHFNNGVVFNDDDGAGIAGPKYELSGAVDITDAGACAQVENDVFADGGAGVKTYASNTLVQHDTFANLQIAFAGEDSGSGTSYGAIWVSPDNSDEHAGWPGRGHRVVPLRRAAAVTNGVEDHVNRIKVLKRQMRGRGNPDLLRPRVLLADYREGPVTETVPELGFGRR